MFFEGSEKKLEVVMTPGTPSLLDKDPQFWHELVKITQAQVLSEISNKSCRAYLLSESSLFVWSNRFTIITCGQTTLARAALHFCKQHRPEDIATLIYERKNEYLPQHQPSDFFSDLEMLNAQIPGKAYRFGEFDEHHLFLFHMDSHYRPEPSDTTLEILMYDLQGVAKETFTLSHQTKEVIREKTGVSSILPGFTIDDFIFDPLGYSLNAIKDDNYYTIHVTPQEESPYVSFETNISMDNNYKDVIYGVLEVFKPQSFDTVVFSPKTVEPLQLNNYQRKNYVKEEVSCGYSVDYTHFFSPNKEAQKPSLLFSNPRKD